MLVITPMRVLPVVNDSFTGLPIIVGIALAGGFGGYLAGFVSLVWSL